VAPSNPLWRDRRVAIYSDIIQEAAALWESLSQNHPLVDGNKRVAGLYETGNLRFKELEAWLRQHTLPDDLPI
jgi:prophage maintenance system killer protein